MAQLSKATDRAFGVAAIRIALGVSRSARASPAASISERRFSALCSALSS
jgi:hypothetical protein